MAGYSSCFAFSTKWIHFNHQPCKFSAVPGHYNALRCGPLAPQLRHHIGCPFPVTEVLVLSPASVSESDLLIICILSRYNSFSSGSAPGIHREEEGWFPVSNLHPAQSQLWWTFRKWIHPWDFLSCSHFHSHFQMSKYINK